jgi:hypothetical protein
MLVFRYIYSAVFVFAMFWAIFLEDLPVFGRLVFPLFVLIPLILNEIQIQKTRKLKAELRSREVESLPNDVHHDYREAN